MSGLIYISLFIYSIYSTHSLLFQVFTLILMTGAIYEILQFRVMCFKNTIRFLLIIYVLISFFIFKNIKNLEYGNILLCILLIQVCASDIGGYIAGSFGKRYFSKISPNKTYEGLAGSIMLSVTIGFIFQQLLHELLDFNFIYNSIWICLASITGDLVMSKIKRLNQKNESGYFLPGHGGFIDRLDSLLLATPVYYLII